MKKLFVYLVLMFMTIGVSLAQNVNLSVDYDENQPGDFTIEILETNDSVIGNNLWTSEKISPQDSIVRAEILMTLDSIVSYLNTTVANLNSRLVISQQELDSLFICAGELCIPSRKDSNFVEGENMTLTEGIGFNINSDYSNDSAIVINSRRNAEYIATDTVYKLLVNIKSLRPNSTIGIYVDGQLSIDTVVGVNTDVTEYLLTFDTPLVPETVIRFDAESQVYFLDYVIFYYRED